MIKKIGKSIDHMLEMKKNVDFQVEIDKCRNNAEIFLKKKNFHRIKLYHLLDYTKK